VSDLIRKAVELADGFDITENQLTFPSGHYFTVNSEIDIKDWMMDCVAAQLVRQVDALPHDENDNENAMVELDFGEVRVYNFNIPPPAANVTKCEGDDRTLNTIKAIVESGVLEWSDDE
jgi:hypothetical protein